MSLYLKKKKKPSQKRASGVAQGVGPLWKKKKRLFSLSPTTHQLKNPPQKTFIYGWLRQGNYYLMTEPPPTHPPFVFSAADGIQGLAHTRQVLYH
jgi:hypothetical protein